jgi:hypothetical protein
VRGLRRHDVAVRPSCTCRGAYWRWYMTRLLLRVFVILFVLFLLYVSISALGVCTSFELVVRSLTSGLTMHIVAVVSVNNMNEGTKVRQQRQTTGGVDSKHGGHGRRVIVSAGSHGISLSHSLALSSVLLHSGLDSFSSPTSDSVARGATKATQDLHSSDPRRTIVSAHPHCSTPSAGLTASACSRGGVRLSHTQELAFDSLPAIVKVKT